MSCTCPKPYFTAIIHVEEPIVLIPKPIGQHHRLVNSAFINSYSQIPSQFGLLSTKLAAMKQELFMQEKSLGQMLRPSSWIFRYWPDLRLKIKKQLRKFLEHTNLPPVWIFSVYNLKNFSFWKLQSCFFAGYQVIIVWIIIKMTFHKYLKHTEQLKTV